MLNLKGDPLRDRNIPTTTTPDEARQRLEAILSDRLLWFNPYRVSDRSLLDCAERGKWSQFPSVTQMMVFHFQDIRKVSAHIGIPEYTGLFFHIGNSEVEHNFSLRSLSYPMTHMVTRQPVWNLVNSRHLVNSNIRSLAGKTLFVSHAINCDRMYGSTHQAYRMHRLYGSEVRCAATVRESMCAAKIAMLEEVLRYAVHPDYLGNPCYSFDYATPILKTIQAIKRFPEYVPPTEHIVG